MLPNHVAELSGQSAELAEFGGEVGFLATGGTGFDGEVEQVADLGEFGGPGVEGGGLQGLLPQLLQQALGVFGVVLEALAQAAVFQHEVLTRGALHADAAFGKLLHFRAHARGAQHGLAALHGEALQRKQGAQRGGRQQPGDQQKADQQDLAEGNAEEAEHQAGVPRCAASIPARREAAEATRWHGGVIGPDAVRGVAGGMDMAGSVALASLRAARKGVIR